MDHVTADPNPHAHRRDSALLFVCVFAACSLLVRGAWHGLDAYSFLSHLERGVYANPRHPLYLPIVGLVVEALRPFGVSVVRAAVFASALGAALGTVLCHRACLLLGMARRSALLCAVTQASCFGVLYYGSMVEIHAVFLLPAGLCWWLCARYLKALTVAAALAVGVGTGLAAAVHATGHLLVAVLGLFVAVRMGDGRSVWRRLPHFGLMLVPHAAIALLVPRLVLPAEVLADASPEAGAVSYFAFLRSLGTDWGQFPRVLWYEWLMPMMPLSVLAPAALLLARTRTAALLFLLALAGYLVLTTMLLAPAAVMQKPEYLPPFATYEFGAYFLPLAFPAAMLALRIVPVRAQILVPIFGVVWALLMMFTSSRAPSDLDYGRDALAVVDEQKARLLIGGYGELDSILQLRPDCGSEPMHNEPSTVLTVYGLWLWLFRFPEYRKPELVTTWFDVQVQQVTQKGGQMVVTDEALALLRATHDGLLDVLVNEHIPAHYELRRIEHGRFRGAIVTRR